MQGRNPDDLTPLPSHILDDQQPVYELYRVRLPVNRYTARGVILGEVRALPTLLHAMLCGVRPCLLALAAPGSTPKAVETVPRRHVYRCF